jgi:serine/threonine protein phosphatase PrpC
MFSWFGFGALKATDAERQAALEGSRIDSLTSPRSAATMVAGGRQTKGALPVRSDAFDAAIYSSRGRGYARYNEDGAELFSDERGCMYAAVFDQAGGLGGVVRGEASQLAALRVSRAFQKIATGKNVDAAQAIYDEMMIAHEELIDRGQGEVTTAVTAVAGDGKFIIVNSGDSGALHFDADGNFKMRTEMHEHDMPFAVGCLTHAVGLVPEGAAPDAYEWAYSPGDWLILCSDGLLDSGLAAEEIGSALVSAESAEDALNTLCRKILRLMTTLRAKPDNLSVVAVHVR